MQVGTLLEVRGRLVGHRRTRKDTPSVARGGSAIDDLAAIGQWPSFPVSSNEMSASAIVIPLRDIFRGLWGTEMRGQFAALVLSRV